MLVRVQPDQCSAVVQWTRMAGFQPEDRGLSYVRFAASLFLAGLRPAPALRAGRIESRRGYRR
ncbi:MAG TPA: hypothetical protein VGQ24_00425 [Gemmatimonadales bacterium]|nr:hypothetical protein [Gemmatimonadales bacterium]